MPPSASTRMPVWQKVVLGLVAALVLLLVFSAFASVLFFRAGTQLHLDGFEMRSYVYYEGFGLRIGRSYYDSQYSSLQQDLVKRRWISQPAANPQNADWLTVQHLHSGRQYTTDAKILHDYLTGQTGRLSLETWGNDNPRQAEVMWHEIEWAARGGYFLLIPDIIHRMTKTPPEEMEKHYYADHPEADRPQENEPSAVRENRERAIARHWLHPYLVPRYRELGEAAAQAELWEKVYFAGQQLSRLDPDRAPGTVLLDRIPAEKKEAAEQQYKKAQIPPAASPGKDDSAAAEDVEEETDDDSPAQDPPGDEQPGEEPADETSAGEDDVT